MLQWNRAVNKRPNTSQKINYSVAWMNFSSHNDLHHWMHLLHWHAADPEEAVGLHVGQEGPSSPRTHNDTLTLICRCSALTHADNITAASEQREWRRRDRPTQSWPFNTGAAASGEETRPSQPLMHRSYRDAQVNRDTENSCSIITPTHSSRELGNFKNLNISEHVPNYCQVGSHNT